MNGEGVSVRILKFLKLIKRGKLIDFVRISGSIRSRISSRVSKDKIIYSTIIRILHITKQNKKNQKKIRKKERREEREEREGSGTGSSTKNNSGASSVEA